MTPFSGRTTKKKQRMKWHLWGFFMIVLMGFWMRLIRDDMRLINMNELEYSECQTFRHKNHIYTSLTFVGHIISVEHLNTSATALRSLCAPIPTPDLSCDACLAPAFCCAPKWFTCCCCCRLCLSSHCERRARREATFWSRGVRCLTRARVWVAFWLVFPCVISTRALQHQRSEVWRRGIIWTMMWSVCACFVRFVYAANRARGVGRKCSGEVFLCAAIARLIADVVHGRADPHQSLMENTQHALTRLHRESSSSKNTRDGVLNVICDVCGEMMCVVIPAESKLRRHTHAKMN